VKRVIAILILCYACGNKYGYVAGSGTAGDPFIIDTSYHPVIYSNEDACKEVVRRGSKRIDSFIMLRCATRDSVMWKRYEDSVVAEIERVTKDVGKDNVSKYLNTHPYKRIPCIIGDSVWLFYKQ